MRKDISPPLWKYVRSRSPPILLTHTYALGYGRTPLWKVIYTISFMTLCVSAFYMYRLTQWKSQAGGWVNLMLGRSPDEPIPSAAEVTNSAKSVTGSRPTAASGSSQFVLGTSLVWPASLPSSLLILYCDLPPVEDRLRELAEELGIHPRELASAIQPIMPSASQTSIAAANPTAADPIVDVLAGGDPDQVKQDAGHPTLSAVAKGLGAIMGADDPADYE